MRGAGHGEHVAHIHVGAVCRIVVARQHVAVRTCGLAEVGCRQRDEGGTEHGCLHGARNGGAHGLHDPVQAYLEVAVGGDDTVQVDPGRVDRHVLRGLVDGGDDAVLPDGQADAVRVGGDAALGGGHPAIQGIHRLAGGIERRGIGRGQPAGTLYQVPVRIEPPGYRGNGGRGLRDGGRVCHGLVVSGIGLTLGVGGGACRILCGGQCAGCRLLVVGDLRGQALDGLLELRERAGGPVTDHRADGVDLHLQRRELPG